jgi:hypothetical protein
MTDVLLFALSMFCFSIGAGVMIINWYLGREE